MLLVALAAVTYLFYIVSVRVFPGGSDKASTILAGQAMGEGNWLLHGWILTSDSLWATDALFYAGAVHVFGLRPILFNVEPAVMAALSVMAGALIAAHGRRGAAVPVGMATVAALLVLPTRSLARFMLGNGFHVSTVLVALVAFLLLQRRRADWSFVLAIVLLGLGMASDLLLVAYAIVPILVAAALAALRERAWRPALVPASAAAGGGVVGLLVYWVRSALGGFSQGAAMAIVHSHQRAINLKAIPVYGGSLLGFNTHLFGAAVVPIDLQHTHLLGTVLVVACLLAAVVAVTVSVLRPHGATADQRDRFLDDTLLAAVAGPVVIFVLLATTGPPGTRYLVPSVMFACVLSGRIVARAWERFSHRLVTRLLGVAGVAAMLCAAAGIGFMVARTPPVPSADRLVTFLEDHDLTRGVGDYWSASVCTVESDGHVAVRPVWGLGDGRIGRSLYESPSSWYKGQSFQFLVYQTPAYEGVDATSAARSWGRPEDAYAIAGYNVLVYARPFQIPPSGAAGPGP